jgi:hypothetical protein
VPCIGAGFICAGCKVKLTNMVTDLVNQMLGIDRYLRVNRIDFLPDGWGAIEVSQEGAFVIAAKS